MGGDNTPPGSVVELTLPMVADYQRVWRAALALGRHDGRQTDETDRVIEPPIPAPEDNHMCEGDLPPQAAINVDTAWAKA